MEITRYDGTLTYAQTYLAVCAFVLMKGIISSIHDFLYIKKNREKVKAKNAKVRECLCGKRRPWWKASQALRPILVKRFYS